jgi:transketolase
MSNPKFKNNDIKAGTYQMSPRRAKYYNIEEVLKENDFEIEDKTLASLEKIDAAYRGLCAILYNFVPRSGHPGGSISSGRIVESLIYQTMDYNFNDPDALENDYICYAAGHKAMGLYAMWALRNECIRIAKPELLPAENYQLRLEDLLGFRRNPVTDTPLYKKFKAKPLDGHPTPLTPFIKLATGASGVGFTAAVGTAFGALDTFGENAPFCHIIEGEGGMTPGRVIEAMATAPSAQMKNVIAHLDWNQASIDSDCVCRDGDTPGDYVQWTPEDMSYVNDWNVIYVPNGFDHKQVLAAQHLATKGIDNNQPTAIVYKTVKGWRYGIEGKGSHGAGHAFCSPEFYQSLDDTKQALNIDFPAYTGDKSEENSEKVFYEFLTTLRKGLEANKEVCDTLAGNIVTSQQRLKDLGRKPRAKAGNLKALFEGNLLNPEKTPDELRLEPGQSVTLRGVLGDTFAYLNRQSKGALMGAAADLFGSTSITNLAKGVSEGFYNFEKNPDARLIMVGGICEDAIGGFMAGLSAFGQHIGVGSSYGAFIAALQHVPARLHAIGQEARVHGYGDKANPFVIICAHAGPRTGEDGPTHADPQPLQLLQENFPKGHMITLTPWDTQEIWPLISAALKAHPSVIAPFVTRPNENVVDRKAMGFPEASAAAKGVYALRRADEKATKYHGTIVLQGNAVGHHFATEVLPELDKKGININVFYIASAELFNLLPQAEQEAIFPESLAREAMGITEFTLSTMYRWVTSQEGRKRTLHTFGKDHFAGSGQAEKVLKEVGLDGQGQLASILDYAAFMEKM